MINYIKLELKYLRLLRENKNLKRKYDKLSKEYENSEKKNMELENVVINQYNEYQMSRGDK